MKIEEGIGEMCCRVGGGFWVFMGFWNVLEKCRVGEMEECFWFLLLYFVVFGGFVCG